MSDNKHTFSLSVPKELHVALKNHALHEMRSMHGQIIYILYAYAKEHKLMVDSPVTEDLDFVDE